MDCRTATRMIVAAESPAPAAEEELARHLAACARCRSEQALAAAVLVALKTEPGPAPRADFATRIRERLPAAGSEHQALLAEQRRIAVRPWLALIPAAAASCAVATLASVDFRGERFIADLLATFAGLGSSGASLIGEIGGGGPTAQITAVWFGLALATTAVAFGIHQTARFFHD